MKSIVYCVLSALMVAAAEARAADRFVVAERGTPPQTTIWCSNAGLEVEKYAANELRNYVRRITGVELPVSLEGKRPSGRVIQLSSGEFADDGFELAVKGETLHVRGGRRAGVLYGVYELLESYGGCGWFASGTEVVPEADTFCVPSDLREPHDDPEDAFEPAWARTKAMAEEFKKYIDVFLSIDPAPTAESSNGDVAVRTWRYKDDTYLLAVNCTTNAQTAVITLSEKVGKVISADFGSAPNVDGNTVNVSLEPIGYCMLRTKPGSY